MALSSALHALGPLISHPMSREMISFILTLLQESTVEGGLVVESSSPPPKSQTQTWCVDGVLHLQVMVTQLANFLHFILAMKEQSDKWYQSLCFL